MFYYTFKNKNGINKLKSIINKIIDEKVSKITITDSKNENKDYISMMNDVIDNYKKELYKK